MSFINLGFREDIYQNVITKIFPLLQTAHKQILLEYLVSVLNIIAYSFNFDFNKSEIYEYQFKQNDYQDVIALLLLLLPFINDSDNTKKKTITSLNDIFITKVNPYTNINIESPEYIYSNLQYDRCIRTKGNIQERVYHKKYLDHNYYLLINTIKLVSNKLYVNWIDILPYDINTYQTTKLYLDTIEKFNNHRLTYWNSSKEYILDDITIDKLSGLSIDDIYNTISIELYHNIKKIKWIIYDVILIYPHIDQPLPLIIVLKYLFDMDAIVSNFKWNTLSKGLRDRFITEWKDFLNLIFNNYDLINDELKLTNYALRRIGRSLLYAFDKSYKDKWKAIANKEYIPFNENTEDIDLDKLEDEEGIFDSREKYSLETLDPQYMYDFIRDSIQEFKYTWYYTHIFDQESMTIKSIGNFKSLGSTTSNGVIVPLTLKNIYNYSKSLTHYEENNKYIEYAKYWQSLNNDQKNIILNRLNNKTTEWFNIKGYIKTTYIQIYDNPLSQMGLTIINNEIHQLVRDKLINIIFESLIIKGILSYFEPNKRITDTSIITYNRNEEIVKILKETTLKIGNNFWFGSYYYLNNMPYSMTSNYFEYNTQINNESKWYTFYALNWISQINFFNKYLNNRIMFVTGATGVGKSTQIPKLLLYALKAIDYNNKGSIICTQPRIAPTQNNADTVSDQLGFPISKTEDYYVQYKYKNNDYTSNVNHLSLKFVTDGLLLQEIRNPILKDTRWQVENDFRLDNQYDIVMIDEAHEHNTNMDLILTLMKFITYYNNDVKLIIASATMDEDEPIYRRYYRDVNDNRMYPLNMEIMEDKIDRINVDRRLDISIPGKTTIYKIVEHYVPNQNPIDIIMKIINEDPDGFILLFEPGINEINKAIKELNKLLPPNVIAIPFYRDMDKYMRKIVEKISERYTEIKINKDYTEFTKDSNNHGSSHYNRVVIVATNIAEASLTISKLKYVIDTGTQKVSIYNPLTRTSSLIQIPITEASRLQRKGRVGRVSTGVVYYMYSKGINKEVELQYNIAISNIYLELYGRLYNSYLEEALLTTSNDPNKMNINLTIDDLSKVYDHNSKGLSKIIKNQYFINGYFYNYIGNPEHYDYLNNKGLNNAYTDGFSLETLTDENGSFYIIHPEELQIRRNIIGTITGLKPYAKGIIYKSNYIISDKIASFWQTLLNDLFMSSYDSKNKLLTKLLTMKTELGKGIYQVRQELNSLSTEDFDIRYVSVLLYGMSLGIGEDIIRLITMNIVTSNDFIMRAVQRNMIDNIKNFIGKQTSDSDAIIYILKDFHEMLRNNKISLDQDNNNINFMRELQNIKKDTISKAIGFGTQGEIQEKIREEINEGKLQNSDELTNADYQEMRKDGISKSVMMSLINNKSNIIQEWSNSHYINSDIIFKYLDKYLTIKNILYINETQQTRNKSIKISELIKLLNTITKYINITDNDKITLSIMYGFKTNIIRQLVDNHYISIYEPTINDVYIINTITPHILNTMVDDRYLQNYILYLTVRTDDNMVSGLHYINMNLIQYIGYVYSCDIMYNKYNKYLLLPIKLEEHTKIISSVVSIYKKVINEIKNDIIEYHDFNIWMSLINIFKDIEYLRLRKYHDINYRTNKAYSLIKDDVLMKGGGMDSQEIDINLMRHLFRKI